MITNHTCNPMSLHHRAARALRIGRARATRAVASLLIMGAAAICAGGCGEQADRLRDVPTPVLVSAFQPDRGLIVPVSIAGKEYHFLVDTGASFTVIDNRIAESVTQVSSGNQMPATFRKMVDKGLLIPDGMPRDDRIRLWHARPIRLGDYEVPVLYPWVGLDLSALTQASGTPIDGIIGMEIFRQLTWLVDNRHGKLTVWRHPPATERFSRCAQYQDSYGLSPGVIINFGEEIGQFRFATGSRYSNMSGPTLAYLTRQKSAIRLSDTAYGVAESPEHLVSGLSFEGQPIGRLRVTEGGDNLLGMNFLARLDRYMFVPWTMEFCYEASHFTQDEPQPLRRIPLRFVDGHVALFSASPEALGRYGLKTGDVLLEINGKRVDASAIADAREQLSTAPVGSLTLTIEREGARQTLQL